MLSDRRASEVDEGKYVVLRKHMHVIQLLDKRVKVVLHVVAPMSRVDT